MQIQCLSVLIIGYASNAQWILPIVLFAYMNILAGHRFFSCENPFDTSRWALCRTRTDQKQYTVLGTSSRGTRFTLERYQKIPGITMYHRPIYICRRPSSFWELDVYFACQEVADGHTCHRLACAYRERKSFHNLRRLSRLRYLSSSRVIHRVSWPPMIASPLWYSPLKPLFHPQHSVGHCSGGTEV